MSAEFFIDTNIIVYLFDETDEAKQDLAENLISSHIGRGSGCISNQVVQESLNVVTRKFGARWEEATQLLDNVLVPLWTIHPSVATYRQSIALQAFYSLSFYDSLIVAAAIDGGCRQLLSEDMQDGLRIQGLTIVNPFAD